MCVANVAAALPTATTSTTATTVFNPVEKISEIALVLRADNDYYSQRGYLESIGQPVTAFTLRQVPKHQPLVGEVSKTGLGSSASLTMSLVACLHACFQSISASNHSSLAAAYAPLFTVERQHRVAQMAHCIAQGKIGSGFDVYTAAYGTSVYRRFDAAIIERVMAKTKVEGSIVSVEIDSVAAAADEATTHWFPPNAMSTATIGRRGLPRGIHLMLADIHQGGTSTPGMASKVLAWRKQLLATSGAAAAGSGSGGAAPNLWDRISSANEAFIAASDRLTSVAGVQGTAKAYDAVLSILSKLPAAQWESAESRHDISDDVRAIVALFCVFRDCGKTVRGLMRDMGVQSGVEIEPSVLTPLLDGTLACPGVAAAGCPGAGGYDAVYALIVQPAAEESVDDNGLPTSAATAGVEQFWETYKALPVCPLLVREGGKGLAVSRVSHAAALLTATAASH